MPAPILDIADLSHRRIAAEATANGAALFYAFGNLHALAARPDLETVQRTNRLKGRPLDQVGSVTTTPANRSSVFDWYALRGLSRQLVSDVMSDLNALGPVGFRGPAAPWIPDHLTVTDRGVRTVQLITPGDACASNALVAEILELTGERILYVTSAIGSAAYCEMQEIQREFGGGHRVALIGHRDERAVRLAYPHHLPCSASILAFHRGVLTLVRAGSLDAMEIRAVLARRGLALAIADGARERIAPRRPRDRALRRVRRGTAQVAG